MEADKLIKSYPIISDQVDQNELQVLLSELELHLQRGDTGSVVEFGCYVGTTSLFIRRLLDAYRSDAAFHVYDSFAGLPAKTTEDESPLGVDFVEGELLATKKILHENFKKAGLMPPVIHKGWFSDVAPDDVPDKVFFAFLDGDYFQSINDSLRAIAPRLAPGATIVVDDVGNAALPGAAMAIHQWAQRRGAVVRLVHSLGIVQL